jgi:hypothetical protein
VTRDEHLAWCKQRALEYVKLGQLQEAFASMGSDLAKHEGTKGSVKIHADLGMPLLMSGNLSRPEQMRDWIEGFN